MDNLALARVTRSLRKAARTDAVDPETGERAPIFNPRTQVWGDHFRWDGVHRSAHRHGPSDHSGPRAESPVTTYTIPTAGDAYQTTPIAGGPDGLVVELSPEPVLLEEARPRLYLPLALFEP